MLKKLSVFATALVAGSLTFGEAAFAKQYLADPWEMWFQDSHSPVMDRIEQFHNLVFGVEVAIVLLVLGLLGYIIFNFNSKRNPVPSKTTHNTLLEVVWTVVPIIILVVIAIPSLKLLYYSDSTPNPDMTLKVTGNQWFWTYTYPDRDGMSFDSLPKFADDLKKGEPRLLTVDNPVVLPVNTNIRVLLTSNDVIHDWAVPALGLKTDNTPGRVNETWVRIEDEGTYYGMCSELCGLNHSFMPIQIEAVSKKKYEEWAKKAQQEYALNGLEDGIPDPRAGGKDVKVAQRDAQ